MNRNGIEVRVLVKGRPITEYGHRGMTFVEGRAGSAYELEITNHNATRVEAVISVDGLAVTDGKEATQHSAGFLIEARSTCRVPGWMLDSGSAAAFEFAGKKGSYATTTTGTTANNGVIGVMAYRERHRPILSVGRGNIASPQHNGFGGSHDYGYLNPGDSWKSGGPWNGVLPSVHNQWTAEPFHDGMATCSLSAQSMDRGPTVSSMAASATSVNNMGALRGIAPSGYNAPEPQPMSLGTAFGDKVGFKTQTVEFERGDVQAIVEVYYASARDLRARGIEVGRREQKFAEMPKAFVIEQGCQPPPGWEPKKPRR